MTQAFDVTQLRVIEKVSYEKNKTFLLELMTAINPDITLYETSDEMVLLESLAYALTYGDEKFNARMRAALPSYGEKDALDDSCKNFYGTVRLDGEDDKAFYNRSLASLQTSVTTGSDNSYIAHTREVDSRISHVAPYRSADGEVTIVWYAQGEQDEEELVKMQAAIEAVIFDPKVRSLCATNQIVKRAEVVHFDISLTLVVHSVFKKNELVAEAKKALRDFFASYHISHEVHISKIVSLAHLSGVASVTLANPASDIVMGKEQVAILRDIHIQTEELHDV